MKFWRLADKLCAELSAPPDADDVRDAVDALDDALADDDGNDEYEEVSSAREQLRAEIRAARRDVRAYQAYVTKLVNAWERHAQDLDDELDVAELRVKK